jgi:uncharacterized protein YfaS (alpha-2-macroglobulin family)
VAAKPDEMPDEMIETPIDLDPALKDGYGQMILRVDPLPHRQNDRAVETWVQRTNIGLDAFVDQANLVGWATSLKDGAPLSGVQMRLLPYGVVGTSGADGAARLALGPQQPKAVNLLVASRGSDLAILPEHVDRWGSAATWFRNPSGDTLRWYVFDDRKIYRPGEEVQIKGWIRRLGGDSRGDVGAPGDAATATDVVYTLKDSGGNEIVKAGTRLSALGGFNLTLKLPPTMNLGDAHVDFLINSKLTGASFTHSFDVEEFRRPEFEVNTKSESSGPHLVGASADLSVTANYYSGGGLDDAAVQWQVNSRPGTFTPPNRGDFTFGKWLPWWGSSYDPATTEAFATYGELDDGAIVQEIKAPADVFKQVGGLEIETSSTQLQQLTDAVLYLTYYPYECSEQLSSRIIGIAALRDVLAAFKSRDLPPPRVLEAAVARDLKRLQGMQNTDGGFGFWKSGDESWPYLSIHVAHALARARQKKLDVPAEMLERSRRYLRGIESHIPSRYGPAARNAVIAYALYTRAQLGERDTLRARRLITEAGLENLSLESIGWLLSVLSGDAAYKIQIDAIHRLLNNRTSETAGTAHFVSSYKDSDYLLLNSDRRADGVILEALINDQKTSDLIPKIVRGLLEHRTRGHWGNTQENVFILLALDRYFNAYEKVTPNFVARVWLGDRYAGEQEFKGRSTDRQQLAVAMSYLVDQGGAQNLIMNKEGPGRLYYRLGLNYAPKDLNLKPADYGFIVERAYEAVDHSEDVQHDADGTWRIKAGARVRVRLTMVAPARRYHVALVDPLPAGLEAINPSLAVTESIPEDKEAASDLEPQSSWVGRKWWRAIWFDHQNLRDDRAEAFTALLWEGVYNYSYVARATTPGVFVVPPVKAEEMYHPETFGRGKTDRVKIE